MEKELNQLYEKIQAGDTFALGEILERFKPCLIKNSLIDGQFNEDCFQELNSKLIMCVKKFQFSSTNISIEKYL